MKYIDEFRNSKVATKFIQLIQAKTNPKRHYHIMEFCGGHTHAIKRYALNQVLPDNIKLIHGPGCPVCILPSSRVDQAIWLAQQPQVIFCTYADMLRVPGSKLNSLLKAKANGADIRLVYSINDAIRIAQENLAHPVIFFACGFETTTPATAHGLIQAQQQQLNNFKVFCNHVLTPAAMHAILSTKEVNLDGFIGPSHVSIIIGSEAYHKIALKYAQPIVIAGFEPLDILQSILNLVELINHQEIKVINQYSRAVSPKGNLHAQHLIEATLEIQAQFNWRGLGLIPHSSLKIKNCYAQFDAEQYFSVPKFVATAVKSCECPQILRGLKQPQECKLFAKACTPETPLGACMVSAEGACAAEYHYAD